MKKAIVTLLLSVVVMTGAMPLSVAAASVPSWMQPDITCMQKAFAAREKSSQTALSAYFQTMSSALTKRGNDLAVAWKEIDATVRNKAIRQAWSLYTAAKQTAKNMYLKSRKAGWTAFKSAIIYCKLSTGEASDAEAQDMGL